MNQWLETCLAGFVLAAACGSSFGQAFPSRPITLMGPKLQGFLHDALRKALDDPEHLKVLQELDQVYWYKSSEDYAKWGAETDKSERALIERLGLLAI